MYYCSFPRNGYPPLGTYTVQNYARVTPPWILNTPPDTVVVGASSDGGIIYAITSSTGTTPFSLYRSTDGGVSFTQRTADGLNTISNLELGSQSVLSVSDNGQTLLLNPDSIRGYYNFYYSDDGGSNFTITAVTGCYSTVLSSDGGASYIQSEDAIYVYGIPYTRVVVTDVTGIDVYSTEYAQSGNTTSLYFDGAYVIVKGIPTIEMNIITVEGFVYFPVSFRSSGMRFFFTTDSRTQPYSAWNNAFLIGTDASDNVYIKITVDDTPYIAISDEPVTTGQWYHWAFCYDGTYTYLCLNGKILAQYTTINWTSYLNSVCFGTSLFVTPEEFLSTNTYLSDFRIFNYDLYTGTPGSSYTIPTVPYNTTEPGMVYIQTFGGGINLQPLTSENYKTNGEYYGSVFSIPRLSVLYQSTEPIGFLSTSSDGTVIVATSTSRVNISIDSGFSWVTSDHPNRVAGSAISGDGSFIYVGLLDAGGSNIIGIGISTDSGTTWEYVYPLNVSFVFQNISCSNSGQYVFVPSGETVYASCDFGRSFTVTINGINGTNVSVVKEDSLIGLGNGQIREFTVYQQMNYLSSYYGACDLSLRIKSR